MRERIRIVKVSEVDNKGTVGDIDNENAVGDRRETDMWKWFVRYCRGPWRLVRYVEVCVFLVMDCCCQLRYESLERTGTHVLDVQVQLSDSRIHILYPDLSNTRI
jgi:hypothetical protein